MVKHKNKAIQAYTKMLNNQSQDFRDGSVGKVLAMKA